MRPRTKADHVNVIAQHCLRTRSVFADLPRSAVDETLAAVVLPSGCERRLAPLLSAHFLGLYGDEVAAALRCPPPGCYASNHLDCSRVPWSALSIEVLVRRLCTLSIDVLSQCIRRLPPNGRPVLNTRSRTKTSNSLACHVRDRAMYLQALDADSVSAAWTAHFPFASPADLPDSHYITAVLEFEYGADVLRCLSTEPLSLYSRAWPVPVPQTTVNSCLNNYFQASKWSNPPVCAACARHQPPDSGGRIYPNWLISQKV
ncbi:hypothetical protein P692DRAFT_20738814 [Suillus brevipes Sb2]|nr:hypothetical protein P692DRAFT_20738814 [Suillus brevipes Sb2]